jgi:hypothetical protein
MVLAISACGPRNARFNPVHMHIRGTLAPPETANDDGVYTMDAKDAGAALCCWIAKQARVEVRKPAGARNLYITVYVPDMPIFSDGHQSLSVSFGKTMRSFKNLRPGFHSFVVGVPHALVESQRSLPVELHAARSFSPPNARAMYSLILTSAYFA